MQGRERAVDVGVTPKTAASLVSCIEEQDTSPYLANRSVDESHACATNAAMWQSRRDYETFPGVVFHGDAFTVMLIDWLAKRCTHFVETGSYRGEYIF